MHMVKVAFQHRLLGGTLPCAQQPVLLQCCLARGSNCVLLIRGMQVGVLTAPVPACMWGLHLMVTAARPSPATWWPRLYLAGASLCSDARVHDPVTSSSVGCLLKCCAVGS
jgi:hypothetical protein